MAESKKGFVLYADLIHTVSKLPDDKAGLLFKHILAYVNDQNPKTEDFIVELTFEPIKQQLKRDLDKWAKIRQKRSEAGKASAEARANKVKEASTNSTSVDISQHEAANSTVIVNDTVSDTVTVSDSVIVNAKDKVKKKKEKSPNVFSKAVHDTYQELIVFFPESLWPKSDKIKNDWLGTIDKLNRIDNVDFTFIVEIVKRVRSDDFWQNNFQTILKLRKNNNDGQKYWNYFLHKFGDSAKSTGGTTKYIQAAIEAERNSGS